MKSSPDQPTPPHGGARIVSARFLAGATSPEQFPPPTLAEIAFAGRSNVGKSSLMNSLTGRKGLVRTSSTPGCTRQVSWFRVQTASGAQLDLVDLPGYGYAKRSKVERKSWAGLIESYLLERPTLRGVVLLVDLRRGAQAEDLELLKLLSGPADVSRPPLQITWVATKADKLSRAAQKPALSAIEREIDQPLIGYSVPQALGRTKLLNRLQQMAGVA